ncbi:expressed unknown protein [Seminavis robusta]|uniref:RxLR effector protein n=1 Tax=Seminavis robusta TaxID=568900 RepID=A0A9N8E3D2_9STRA|nr:expressed unknown protein [Seminavis robusta]|eukprot:Sro513_g157830.1 n/a (114) ;mRNA; r:30441-30782
MRLAMLMMFVWLASLLCRVEALVFVTAKINPVAAIKAVNPINVFSSRVPHDTNAFSTALNAREKHVKMAARLLDSSSFGHSDDTIQSHRDEIVDLVYLRSLQRMNGFGVEPTE